MERIRIIEDDEPKNAIKRSDLLRVREGFMRVENAVEPVIQARLGKEFAAHAFWLNEYYNWTLGTDSAGQLILVPTKKTSSAE